MKKVLILGSTGSIGESTLDVISRFPDRFKVEALVAGKNVEKLKEQVEKFKPKAVCLVNSKDKFSFKGKFYLGLDGLKKLIEEVEFDICVSAITGSAGILPTYWAANKGARIAIANKESLVCAGKFIMEAAKKVIPVDSEHSAIFQCLNGESRKNVKEIILTASGGPFRKRKDLESVTPQEALRHPNWDMGQKVTIDSATLMNKGLEVIEAYWLFGLELEKIKVLVHPQSIVHSFVRFIDNSVLAQLGVPDMRIPIAYALSYPERLPLDVEKLYLNLYGLKLDFEEPDLKRFPALKLAYDSLKSGYPYPIVLNAADEVAVELFLKGKIKFTQIPVLIEKTLQSSKFKEPSSIEEVIEIDKEARKIAMEISKCL
ncbi:1-deoxy-D-xylulose 5-phosphate reductoisomerase [Desulfurobacterium thermolithotrophum DSM 11699]|uniref:1-deoxy-D-xylulose 5-phosphate reductoisomerase n=1 Tax=Desulfurobacterium thermolithotrophum (strain DSM 11699 / BSA) TaxID=868864 RepID=F0S1V0_DESTD|nr:1-deoxy-D-xylulose-5-phosphate reductoisomerase [Desulfurobacterium thermolithotrophum]ADY72955.1 1-deoxy-D-xylulose 5-phosphate reductoisomerase [Desulfurobacterium thermolithotrophum DSM 11699]